MAPRLVRCAREPTRAASHDRRRPRFSSLRFLRRHARSLTADPARGTPLWRAALSIASRALERGVLSQPAPRVIEHCARVPTVDVRSADDGTVSDRGGSRHEGACRRRARRSGCHTRRSDRLHRWSCAGYVESLFETEQHPSPDPPPVLTTSSTSLTMPKCTRGPRICTSTHARGVAQEERRYSVRRPDDASGE